MNKTIAFLLLFVITVSHTCSQVTAIICKQIIDGKSSVPLKATVILLEGERIKAIGQRDIIPKGTHTVDLSSYTVMPGFIDLHCHPLGDSDDDYQTYHLKKQLGGKGAARTQKCTGYVDGGLDGHSSSGRS